MSLPETIWWCNVYENTTERPESCRSKPVMHVRCQELRVAGPDDLLIRREADGSWPDWVLVGLGWELDDSHDLSAVMDGVWRERLRAAAEGETP